MSDPLDPVRAYLETHTIRDLAAAAGVPRATIHNWLTRGTPLALIQGLKVLAVTQAKAKPAKRRKATP